MPKRGKLELMVVSCSCRGAQGQCPAVAVMSCSAKHCLTAVVCGPGQTAIAARPPDTLWILSVCQPYIFKLPWFIKYSFIPRRLGAIACHQEVWLAHHFSPEPPLTPVSSFSVDQVQPQFIIYHLQPGLMSVSIGLSSWKLVVTRTLPGMLGVGVE